MVTCMCKMYKTWRSQSNTLFIQSVFVLAHNQLVLHEFFVTPVWVLMTQHDKSCPISELWCEATFSLTLLVFVQIPAVPIQTPGWGSEGHSGYMVHLWRTVRHRVRHSQCSYCANMSWKRSTRPCMCGSSDWSHNSALGVNGFRQHWKKHFPNMVCVNHHLGWKDWWTKNLSLTNFKKNLKRQYLAQVNPNKSASPVTWREQSAITVWIFSIFVLSLILHWALLSPIRLSNGWRWQSCTKTDKGPKRHCS